MPTHTSSSVTSFNLDQGFGYREQKAGTDVPVIYKKQFSSKNSLEISKIREYQFESRDLLMDSDPKNQARPPLHFTSRHS